MSRKITNREKSQPPVYGAVTGPQALGRLLRAERRRQKLTLQDLYGATGLTTRFLSEFERGKPNASVGRVLDALHALGLEVIVLPRAEARRVQAALARDGHPGQPGPSDPA